jgi:hypothetical protein
MVKHRGLNLKRFISVLPWVLFEAYFNQLNSDAKPDAWAWLNPGELFRFLDDEQNFESSTAILEDFHRVNDLAAYLPYLLYAYSRAGIEWREDESPEAGSMRLFLTDREAFEYAWTLYLLQATSARRCEYYFPAGDLTPSLTQVENLRANLSGLFSNIKRGEQCIASTFKDGAKLHVRITRGKTMKTDARWKGMEVTFETFRPASEDVLTYEADRSLLTLFGGGKADRERYIRSFAEYVAGFLLLAEVAINTIVFSLEPFRDGSFSYVGNALIRRIWMTELEFLDEYGTLQDLKGGALWSSLESQNLMLSSLDLKRVGLRFAIQTEGMKAPLETSVDIQPPGFTDLAQKRFGDVIEDYLRRQGVKLY